VSCTRRLGVVLVGLAYYPGKSPSDKTFMRDVANAAVVEHSVTVHIISIAETRRWSDLTATVTDHFAPVEYVPRPFHHVSAVESCSLAHARHGAAREYCERSIAALALTRVLKRLRTSGGVSYVHFFDNLGPTASLAAHAAGLRCGVTLLASRGSSVSAARRLFWRVSCRGVDDVVAGSTAMAEALESSGVRVKAVIPWGPGVSTDVGATPFHLRRLAVWTGRLSSCGADELMLAAQAMQLARRSVPELIAQVWPKPEYAREYSSIAASYGMPASVPGSSFVKALDQVRVLVSPTPGPNHIAGPPLTWLEAIRMGCRVVTTPCRGLAAELTESEAVVVAAERSAPALSAAIERAWRRPAPRLPTVWTARDAAERYVDLWRNG